MRRYDQDNPARNREDSPIDCGEISSGLRVTWLGGPGRVAPTRFGCLGMEHEVAAIVDRWPGIDHEYVKVGTANGDTYILRYDMAEDAWEITLFEEGASSRKQRPAERARGPGALRQRSAGS